MRVLVIGAGIAGLGAATYFARRGHTVEVIEAADRAGGRALTLQRRGSADRVDVGTQYYHSTYTRGIGLMREVGLADRLTTIHGDSRFFDDRVARGSFLVDHRLPWFRPAGALGNLRLGGFLAHRLIRHPMDTFGLEEQPELDGIAAWDAIHDPTLREFLLRPLTLAGAITEPEPTQVSLLHVLRLIRIIVLTDYLTLPGGIASLHEALAARLAVRLGTPARRLVEERGRIVGVELDGSGAIRRADHVVVATTPPAALRLVPEDWTLERAFLASVTIPPFAFPTFFLDRPLEPNVWSYVAQQGRGHQVSLVLDAARKNPEMVPSGKSVLQPWPCYPASTALWTATDDEVIDTCRRELETWMPGFSGWIEQAHVTRHPYAVPFHSVGHQGRAMEFLACVDERKGVSFCGDYLSGGYVEPALWSAERAAARFG
ncbi:MAG: FAD-dependent oxidoreductase [Myxococcales bacterium]|nr:FAD-dependent oxidoreductase [Myxococcales bacterium]